MPYPGVPKELIPKMDSCVKKVMKDGKDKSSAIAICETSIMSQKERKKEKPYEIVASKEKKPETRLVYFSQTPTKKSINASKEGKILKNVEIFKSGIYRGIQFKNSGLDKMVANFYYLKAFNVFPNVPVRADHPSGGFFGGGNIVDNIGGYIKDIKRKGNKLIADFRITSEKMWNKIIEGSYVSRSAEIGTYDDNNGVIYSPILYGVAWVDIPQVEGLSPTFNYSRNNKNFELINLNAIMNMPNEKEFPPVKEEKKEENLSIKKEEVKKEKKEVEIKEEKKEIKEHNKLKENSMKTMEKEFPKEAKELKALREEKKVLLLKERETFVDLMEKEGKILPAQVKDEKVFVKDLTEEQFNKYKEMKEKSVSIVKLDKEVIEKEEEEEKKEEDKEETADEKADKFIKETN